MIAATDLGINTPDVLHQCRPSALLADPPAATSLSPGSRDFELAVRKAGDVKTKR